MISFTSKNVNFQFWKVSGCVRELKALQHSLTVMSRPHNSCMPLEMNKIWFLTHNLSICMVTLSLDPRVKNVYYSDGDISRFQFFNNDSIQGFFKSCLSSCTSITSNLVWEFPSLMKSWNCEVDRLKDYLCLESYLSDILSHN